LRQRAIEARYEDLSIKTANKRMFFAGIHMDLGETWPTPSTLAKSKTASSHQEYLRSKRAEATSARFVGRVHALYDPWRHRWKMKNMASNHGIYNSPG
jgi:hypothetical protein